jgi:hypothetical protein
MPTFQSSIASVTTRVQFGDLRVNEADGGGPPVGQHLVLRSEIGCFARRGTAIALRRAVLRDDRLEIRPQLPPWRLGLLILKLCDRVSN